MAGESGAFLLAERAEIESALQGLDVVSLMESAFEAYSAGRTQVSAVGELLFEDPPGEAHIKSAAARGENAFVVKVATGFYDNPKNGLPSSSGVVLLFDAGTGALRSLLLDEGRLTDERTAAAGAVAARHLCPEDVGAIGILGAGIQARLQLAHLCAVTPCRRVIAWARRPEAVAALAAEAQRLGFRTEAAASPADVAVRSRLIVTTTPAAEPLLFAADVQPGTHITAVGADTPGKGELATDLLARAEMLIADSRSQCRERGELRRAPAQGRIVELGEVIAGTEAGRQSQTEITICDLTGVAAQDLAIARAIETAIRRLRGEQK
ncbi:MAG TPA: hypothetical protein VGS12_08955 [Caulobacteraceae bacterium]|nr:hypothetical protein [Caulobacteraceae bacterium]